MARFFCRAISSIDGQSAAACWGVRFACEVKLGSLNPSRYFAPAGMRATTVLTSKVPPQTIGTNSMPALWYAVAAAGLGAPDHPYYHLTPGDSAARPAGGLARSNPLAIPRLHGARAV